MTLLEQEIAQLTQERGDAAIRRRNRAAYAIRNLLDLSPAARDAAASEPLLTLVRTVLGLAAFPVRATLFDKTLEDNWPVAWHQDRAIAVRERRDAPGFQGWSVKAGVVHVQPPDAILEGMIALRLHLDPCDEESGALRVIPGSHRYGILSDEDADRLVNEGPAIHCAVPAGGILLMRPLLLHASSPTRSLGHRRVIHIEYAAHDLPAGLQWATPRPASGFLP